MVKWPLGTVDNQACTPGSVGQEDCHLTMGMKHSEKDSVIIGDGYARITEPYGEPELTGDLGAGSRVESRRE